MSEPLPPSDVSFASRSRSRRSIYFLTCAAILLAAVIVGFGPTFFLRMWLQEDSLPAYLLLHGAVLTLWFLLFFAQSFLVFRDKLGAHRRLGTAGALLAPVVVITALTAIFGIVTNAGNNGFDIARDRGQMEFIIWSDLGALLAFIIFVALGLAVRRRADAHKRLMLLGSLSIMSPAFIRLSELPPFNALGGVIFVLLIFLLMTLSLVLLDLKTKRRIHA
ncbi:MAG: hypothetical protein EOP21_07150, partial [Hyphomicrobiales bacterium]